MISPRLFVCSGAKVGQESTIAKGRQRVNLDSIGSKSNVNIRVENVTRALHQHPHPRLVDFLEIRLLRLHRRLLYGPWRGVDG